MKKSELLPVVTLKEKSPYLEKFGKARMKIQEVKDSQVSVYIPGFGHYAWIPISQLEFCDQPQWCNWINIPLLQSGDEKYNPGSSPGGSTKLCRKFILYLRQN